MKMNILSYFMSTTALALYCGSYFFNNKKKYLVLQLTGNFFYHCLIFLWVLILLWFRLRLE